MSISGRFWLPGPVEVDPAVTAALGRPVFGHRTVLGHAIAERVQHGLRRVFATGRPVLMTAGSATAMMEAAVRGGVRQRLLAVVSGSFGERFARIGEACGLEVTRLHVPRGRALEPAELESLLDGPPFDAISLVHVETSTGAVADVAALIAVSRRRDDVVTIVDAVGSLGGMPVDPEGWDADFVIGAPQKAVAAPAGLAFAVTSDRFLERARTIRHRGLYLDPLALHADAEQCRFPQTPPVPVIHALDCQLERILAAPLAQRFARHRALRERLEHWDLHCDDMRLLAPPGIRADTVSVLALPDGLSARALVADLAHDGYQVAPGHDDPEDRLVRIGHMGEATVDQLEPLLAALDARR